MNADNLPDGALLLMDSSPIIYVLERHSELAFRFMSLFEAQASGRLNFAVTTLTVWEVMTGPLRVSDEALARQYRAILESWQVVPLDLAIAESAARLRARSGLKTAECNSGGQRDRY